MPIEKNGTKVINLLKRWSLEEITEVKDTSGNLIHKRVNVYFMPNGGTGGSSQTRTWGVEQVLVPPTPTRAGYTFVAWDEVPGYPSTVVNFPILAPNNHMMVYARWAKDKPITATPSLSNMRCESKPVAAGVYQIKLYVTIRNRDASTVRVSNYDTGEELIASLSPSTSREVLIYNKAVAGGSAPGSSTVRVRALALSDKQISNIASLTTNLTSCVVG